METLATHEIPVEFMNPDQKMEIISSSASSVKLLISGAKPLINSIRSEQINIKLNLSQAEIGVNKLSITKENILLPPGIRLKNINPSTLDITLDTLIEKQLPIQPNWTGKLPKGLIMMKAETFPKTIRVTGGGMELKKISTIFTEQILLDKLKKSGIVTIGLLFNPASFKLKDSKKIQIKYHIAKKQFSNQQAVIAFTR
jgi:YbbR domain-containing protein